MNIITDRQKNLLEAVVEEYIKTAEPISSQLAEENFDLGVSPATIRNDMLKLSELGYLFQPHISAGRVPTDKGYRFFVNDLESKKESSQSRHKFTDEFDALEKETDGAFEYMQTLTKTIAHVSSNLAISFLAKKDLVFKEGWKEIFEEPEFNDAEFRSSFVQTIDCLESKMDEFASDLKGMVVFIGSENPISEAKDFSMIISKCSFNEAEDGAMVILGPKRMKYGRNINLMKSLVKLLNK